MKNILISIAVSLVLIIIALNTPAGYWNLAKLDGRLGALSLTDITSSNQLSAYPAVQNANNTLIENQINNLVGTTTHTTLTTANSLTSASALATVGTLTSGSLGAGFTTVATARGGTATTTWLNGALVFYDSVLSTLSQANTQAALFYDKTNDRLSIASSTSPYYKVTVGSGAIHVVETTIATSTNISVDARNGNQQRIGIANAATTITITNLVEGQKLNLVVCNPAAGTAGTITWASTPANRIRWSAGAQPTQTTTAGNCDVWSFLATQATTTGVMYFGAQSATF